MKVTWWPMIVVEDDVYDSNEVMQMVKWRPMKILMNTEREIFDET